jgi:hypothetical protein
MDKALESPWFMVAGLAWVGVVFWVLLRRCTRAPKSIEEQETDPTSTERHHTTNYSQATVRQRPQVDPLDDAVFDEQVKGGYIILIKYNDNGSEKKLRIKKQIAPKWGDLASLLGFLDAEKDTIRISNHYKNEVCTGRMLEIWMAKDEDHTWRRLILGMREAELGSAARDLAKALRNRVN